MKKVKSLLCVFLSMVLILGIIPISVFADSFPDYYYVDAPKIWVDNETPILLKDGVSGEGWSCREVKNRLVLTLSNFNGKYLMTNKNMAIILTEGTTNTLTYGMEVEGASVTVYGEGTLNITQLVGFSYSSKLWVYGGTINITKKDLPSFKVQLTEKEVWRDIDGEITETNESIVDRDLNYSADHGLDFYSNSSLNIYKGNINISGFNVGLYYECESDPEWYINNGRVSIDAQEIAFKAYSEEYISVSWVEVQIFSGVSKKDKNGNGLAFENLYDSHSLTFLDALGEHAKSAILEKQDASYEKQANESFERLMSDLNGNSNSSQISSNNSVSSKPQENSSKPTVSSKPTTNVQAPQGTDKPLTTVDYLAFSKLAYFDWNVIGQSVEEKIADKKNEVFNKEIIDTLGKSVSKTDLDFYSITYEMLCKNILNWKVVSTSKTWGKSKEAGFYAVTFYNESLKQAVVAYRGSTGFDKIKTEDGYNDWIENDLQFHLFNKYTGQLQEAKDYYLFCKNLDSISSANITATGHSLGGALGQTVSMTYGVYAEVFNAASVFEALYLNTTDEMSASFDGADKWNFVSHVNEKDMIGSWLGKYKNLPHVAHKDNYTTMSADSVGEFFLTFIHPHSLQSLIWCDTSTGEIRMSSSAKASVPKGFTIGKKTPLLFGTSSDDILIYVDVEDSSTEVVNFYGGDGNDLLQSFGKTNDYFLGGSSNKEDKLVGGLGNDTYIYNKGDGIQWINDVGGQDVIRLLGLEVTDVIAASGEHNVDGVVYKEITLNGSPIIYVSLNRSKKDSFNINNEGKTLFSLTGNWEKFYSAYVACPVDVDILDANGNVVMTMKDKSSLAEHTAYGNFYVFEDENRESCKRFDLIEGYTAKIRGVGEGTMDVAVLYDSNNTDMDVIGVKNVPVTKSTTATFKFETGKQTVLLVDDGVEQTEFVLLEQKTITLDAGDGNCDVASVKTDFAGVVPELPIPTRDGYEFNGWKTAEGTSISEGDTVFNDITVHAEWITKTSSTNIKSNGWWIAIVVVIIVGAVTAASIIWFRKHPGVITKK